MYRKNLTMFSKPWRLRACHVLVGWSRVVSLLLPPPPEWRRWCFQLWVSVNLSVRKGFWQDFGNYSQYWSLGLAPLYKVPGYFQTCSTCISLCGDPMDMFKLITGRNEVLAKVIFLHLSVILFTGGAGVLPARGGSPCQTPPRAWRTPPEQNSPRADTPPRHGGPPDQTTPP